MAIISGRLFSDTLTSLRKAFEKDKVLYSYLAILFLWLLKVLISSDQDPYLTYGPHDSGLYAEKAFYLFEQGNFGPFHSKTLLKNSSISILLFILRHFYIPFFTFVQFVILLASFQTFKTFSRKLTLSVSFLLALIPMYAPPILDGAFNSLGRDGISAIAFVLFLVSFFAIILDFYEKKNDVLNTLAFLFSYTFILFIREEGVLYLFFLVPLTIFRGIHLLKDKSPRFTIQNILPVFRFPGFLFFYFFIIFIAHIALHYKMYHVAIYNDLSAGNFPGLVNSLRRIDNPNKSPYVSIPHETLELVAQKIPEFAPVVSKIHPPPSNTDTFFHHAYKHYKGIVNQWPDSHHLIWIKDATWDSGVTTNPADLQKFYKHVASRIDSMCKSGELKCSAKHSGLMQNPLTGGRFFNFIYYFFDGITRPWSTVYGFYEKGNNYVNADIPLDVQLETGYRASFVTLSMYDSLLQFTNSQKKGLRYSKNIQQALDSRSIDLSQPLEPFRKYLGIYEYKKEVTYITYRDHKIMVCNERDSCAAGVWKGDSLSVPDWGIQGKMDHLSLGWNNGTTWVKPESEDNYILLIKYDNFKKNLRYWLNNPDVAMHDEFGLPQSMRKLIKAKPLNEKYIAFPPELQNKWRVYDYKIGLGLDYLLQNEEASRRLFFNNEFGELKGESHFENFGKQEGRKWFDPRSGEGLPALRVYHSPLIMVKKYSEILTYLVLLVPVGLILLVINLLRDYRKIFEPATFFFVTFLAFDLLHALSLATVAATMGIMDPRMFFGVIVGMILIPTFYVLTHIKAISNHSNDMIGEGN